MLRAATRIMAHARHAYPSFSKLTSSRFEEISHDNAPWPPEDVPVPLRPTPSAHDRFMRLPDNLLAMIEKRLVKEECYPIFWMVSASEDYQLIIQTKFGIDPLNYEHSRDQFGRGDGLSPMFKANIRFGDILTETIDNNGMSFDMDRLADILVRNFVRKDGIRVVEYKIPLMNIDRSPITLASLKTVALEVMQAFIASPEGRETGEYIVDNIDWSISTGASDGSISYNKRYYICGIVARPALAGITPAAPPLAEGDDATRAAQEARSRAAARRQAQENAAKELTEALVASGTMIPEFHHVYTDDISAILKLGENRRAEPISAIKDYNFDERKDITLVTTSGAQIYRNMRGMNNYNDLIGTHDDTLSPSVRFSPVAEDGAIEVEWDLGPYELTTFTIKRYEGIIDKSVVREINMNLGAALRILMRLLEHAFQSYDQSLYKRTFARDCEELFDEIFSHVQSYENSIAQLLLKKAMKFFSERCNNPYNFGHEYYRNMFVGWWMIIGAATGEWGLKAEPEQVRAQEPNLSKYEQAQAELRTAYANLQKNKLEMDELSRKIIPQGDTSTDQLRDLYREKDQTNAQIGFTDSSMGKTQYSGAPDTSALDRKVRHLEEKIKVHEQAHPEDVEIINEARYKAARMKELKKLEQTILSNIENTERRIAKEQSEANYLAEHGYAPLSDMRPYHGF